MKAKLIRRAKKAIAKADWKLAFCLLTTIEELYGKALAENLWREQ